MIILNTTRLKWMDSDFPTDTRSAYMDRLNSDRVQILTDWILVVVKVTVNLSTRDGFLCLCYH